MTLCKVRKSALALAAWTLLVLTIFAPAPIHAQVAGASVSGRVSDASGAVIVDAKVTIEHLGTNAIREVITDNDGFYTAPNLLPGNYQISVSATGFSTQVQKGLTLTVGGQQTADFTMQVGSTSATVEVTAEAVTVQLTSSAITAVVDSTTVRELPLNGRSWTDLAKLQPGVTPMLAQFSAGGGTDRGERGFGAQLSISGGKPVQNNYRLDGISLNDYANGAPGSVIGQALGVDAIQEFSVITSNYSTEYGRTSGGVVNAITRSGTNQFHGSAYEFLRNSALDARNFFDPATIPPFKRNQFGVSGGGPIRKDRTFIFADYEGIRQSKGVATSAHVPSDTARTGVLYNVNQTDCGQSGGAFNTTSSTCQVTVDPAAAKYLPFWPKATTTQPQSDVGTFFFTSQQKLTENFVTTRIDQKFSESDSIFGTYLYDHTPYTTPDGLDVNLNSYDTSRQLVAIEESHIFSPTLFNSLRFGFDRVGANNNVGVSGINPLATDPTLASTPGQFAARVNVGGGQLTPFGGGLGAIDHNFHVWNSYQVYDDAFLSHGTHSLKFGGGVERMQNYIKGFGDAAGNWGFGSLLDFLTNNVANNAETFTSALVTASPRNIRQTLVGAYIQDDWRWRPNLTFNVGLRYEMVTVPEETNGKFVNLRNLTDALPYCGVAQTGCAGTAPLFSNPTLHNFEPRVGFAWDPFHNGKTSVRGGFGMFDVLPLPYIVTLLEVRPAPFSEIGATSTGLAGKFFTGAYSLLGPNSLGSTYIEPHPHRNYVMQWNMTVQRELTPTVTMIAGYVGSRGRHQQFRVDDADMVLPTLTSEGYVWPFPDPKNPNALPVPTLNPNFGSIRADFFRANSSYDSLVLGATKKMSHGVQFQSSFTWGKSIDENSAGAGADSFQNSLSSLHWYDMRLSKAVSDYNIGRTLVVSVLYNPPAPKVSWSLAKSVLGGWEFGTIFSANDGLPVTPIIGADIVGQNSSDPWSFPDRVPCKSLTNPGNLKNYINLDCFQVPTAKTQAFYNTYCNPAFAFPTCVNRYGNAGRNVIVGPGLADLDFSAYKNFPLRKISENFNIQFRAEFFNVINRANFGPPADTNVIFDGTLTRQDGSAGVIDTTSTDPRQIQFALKFVW
jgi:outer membrane receptor protein involved in Fe transport